MRIEGGTSSFRWGVYGVAEVHDLEWPTDARSGEDAVQIMVTNPENGRYVSADHFND